MSTRDLEEAEQPEGPNKAPKRAIPTAANPPLRGRYTVPFFTIENVMRVDADHIMVAVDNNLPFSSGRALDRAADNEFFLIRAPELLAAR